MPQAAPVAPADPTARWLGGAGLLLGALGLGFGAGSLLRGRRGSAASSDLPRPAGRRGRPALHPRRCWLGAAPAFAHTRLLSSDPADGASLDTVPQQVSLTFNEPMQAGFATVTVIGPDGTPYQAGQITTDGGTVTVGVAPLGPAGRYEIGYRVISEDGHPVTGSVAFTMTAPGPAAAAATPAPAAAPHRPRHPQPPTPPRRRPHRAGAATAGDDGGMPSGRGSSAGCC